MTWNTLLEFFALPNDLHLEPFMDQMWHFESLLASPRPLQQITALAGRSHSTCGCQSKPGKLLRASTRESDNSESFHFRHAQKLRCKCASKNSSNIVSERSEGSLRTNQTDSAYPYFPTAELRTVFETFDENGDGRLSVDEISSSMAKLGLEMTKRELASTIAAIDKNGDGFVDSKEFFSLYNLNFDGEFVDFVEKEDRQNLKRAFRVFDKNKDGYITAQELHTVLLCIGSSQESKLEDCRKMIRGADLDGDGKVNFLEFQVMMSKKSPKCSGESRNIVQKSRSANYF